MRQSVLFLGWVVLGLGVGVPISSQAAPSPPSWEELALKQGLTQHEVDTLRKQKILITNKAFKQVFSPYLQSRLPIFVTSDSVLNAFHVLYEESIFRLECENARKLGTLLQELWKNLGAESRGLTGSSEVLEDARRHSRVMLGTALALLGEPVRGVDREISELVKEETARIEEAEVQTKPAWLGPPDPGFLSLDYSRYRPRGFYTKRESLQRYFRAVSWLQSVPFRIDKDGELLAALLLGKSVGRDAASSRDGLHGYLRQFRILLGAGDDWDIILAGKLVQGLGVQSTRDLAAPGFLARARKRADEFIEEYGLPQINDTVGFPPGDPRGATAVNFRVVSAGRIPDSVVFTRTTSPLRGFPTGLEVGAALGGEFPRTRILERESDGAAILRTIDEAHSFFKGDSLYQEYLHCIAALLDKPDEGAPDFLNSHAWQAKSCQTALAGWAQLRHTWALQAKQSVTYLSAMMTEDNPDVVEPDPEFFARLKALCLRTREILDRTGVLQPSPEALASDLHELLEWIEDSGILEGKRIRVDSDVQTAGRLEWFHILRDGLKAGGWKPQDLKNAAEKVRQLEQEIRRGKLPEDPRLKAALEYGSFEVGSLWTGMIELCHWLETIARKEVRGEALSDGEAAFLRSYGRTLAGIMLYKGNSYLSPRDDAPRVVDVHYNPNDADSPYLEAGIGRPRALYVLYPGKHGEYLCRGAVLPYYEFQSSSRLTDAEWKRLLDGKERPAIPYWVEPVVVDGGLRKPVLKPH